MMMYSLSVGRQGLLVTDDGEVHAYQLTKAGSFFSEDIVMDPIRLYNDKRQGFYRAPTTPLEKTAERLATQGYTVFTKYSSKGRKYGFAVIIGENDSEMD